MGHAVAGVWSDNGITAAVRAGDTKLVLTFLTVYGVHSMATATWVAAAAMLRVVAAC
jgi:hypothetical protein